MRPPPCHPAGKTTLIDSVLDGRPGVVSVAATRGAELNDIVDKALHAIASCECDTRASCVTSMPAAFCLHPSVPTTPSAADEVNVFDGLPGAERVIKWHKRLFQAPPTVVLRVREQPPDAEPPAAASAARLLADTYGVQVIIDSDVALKTTPCCRVNVRRG